jgi:hypothetical protein
MHSGFNGIAEGALGAVIKVGFFPENREPRSQLRDLLIGQHYAEFSEIEGFEGR